MAVRVVQEHGRRSVFRHHSRLALSRSGRRANGIVTLFTVVRAVSLFTFCVSSLSYTNAGIFLSVFCI